MALKYFDEQIKESQPVSQLCLRPMNHCLKVIKEYMEYEL